MTPRLIPKDEAIAILPCEGLPPVTVIGTDKIRETFDETCLQQAINSRQSPGVTNVVLNPDGHLGYGAPIGCVMSSPTHIYPGPVGVDIKCSMSLLQTNIPEDAIQDKAIRRQIINAICARIPTGTGKGQRSVKKSRSVDTSIIAKGITHGATPQILEQMGIPASWAERCEDAAHVGHDLTHDALEQRLDWHLCNNTFRDLESKLNQVGSYGGGNHFGECEIVSLEDNARARHAAEVFGLKDKCVAFLSHCGSRGIGHNLASGQFKTLQDMFRTWKIPFPGGDPQLVYAPLGTPEADNYIDDMSIGANFATLNHLLINSLVLEAFQEVLPGTQGELVYFISHNIARRELVDDRMEWVHRKGATRAFPGGHPALSKTRYKDTGHPILLPGNPQAGSAVMVADPNAKISSYSVNHGAGRVMGRKRAIRELNQERIDKSFADRDILTNCRTYPRDEAPQVYKDFDEVLKSVKLAGLASEVARLRATFVIKDGDAADD